MLSLAVMLGGCPKRQTNPTLIYVPAPPRAAASAPAKPGGVLVIEEPAPPEPQEQPAQAGPSETPTPKPRPRRRTPTAAPPVDAEPAPENATQPAMPAPALEPRESPQQQNELRTKSLALQQTVQARIARLEQPGRASLDRQTVEGARMFLAQSQRALESGDLQRAFNLARKASLLVDALEQKP